jgi:geranylgeranylglycerol-phosphate geranylgeranyltransferase
MRRRLAAFRLVHPFPSTLNALVTAGLALVAGGSPSSAAVLAVAMLGFQCSIGALNDLVDAPVDALAKPSKPIPRGLVTPRLAGVVVLAGGATGLALSGLAGPAALLIGSAGYACGLAYDLVLRRVGLGWLAFAIALPLLVCYPWVTVTGSLPPRSALVLGMAALAGPALHIANALVDLDRDRASEAPGIAVRLGLERSVALVVLLSGIIYAAAWLTLLTAVPVRTVTLVAVVVASGVGAVGILGSASPDARRRAWGWSFQAIALGCLTLAWFAAVA